VLGTYKMYVRGPPFPCQFSYRIYTVDTGCTWIGVQVKYYNTLQSRASQNSYSAVIVLCRRLLAYSNAVTVTIMTDERAQV